MNQVTNKISADSADISYKGFEFADIQLGGDYKVTPAFGIGPWLAFSLGQYSSGTVTAPNGQSLSGDITDKGMHEWLMFGVRGVYDISM